MTDGQTITEGKRDKVRRLVIDPMNALGFRRWPGVRADDWSEQLTKIADHLGYMAEDRLAALFDMLKTKGTGPRRDVWPALASIISLAHIVQPRPVEDMPNLVSWFRSVEGPKARDAGVLVEQFQFFERRGRPPLNQGEHRAIADRAYENRRRLQIIAERTAPTEEDRAFSAAWERDRKRVEAIMAGGQQGAAS